MSDDILKIASLITEDPDIFDEYQEKFQEHTTLDEEIFGDIVGILKQVADDNGLTLDHRRLKVKFNPAGLTIKNIYLNSSDPNKKRELIANVAEITGDENIKNNFNKNLRTNLYLAINREFADRVREELNLEVTHQSNEPVEGEDPSEIMPMATFTQPAVRAEQPEEEIEPPSGPEPDAGPEGEPMPGPEEDFGLGGLGGMGGMGGPPMDFGAEEEVPEELGGEEPEVGPFGVEEPSGEAPEGEEEVEEAPPPEEGEEDTMLAFEDIQGIADLLTEDPDILAENLQDCLKCGKPNRINRNICWACGRNLDDPARRGAPKTTDIVAYEPAERSQVDFGLVLGRKPKFEVE